MVKRCAWGTCNSDDRYKEKPHMENVTFWPIPKPKARLAETREWVKACGRKDFTIDNVDKHAYVCSKHFVEGKPTEDFPYPMSATDPFKAAKKGRKPLSRQLFPTVASNRGKKKTSKTQEHPDLDIPKPVIFTEISTDENNNVEQTAFYPEESYLVPENCFVDHEYAKPISISPILTSTVACQTNLCFDDIGKYDDSELKDVGELKRRLIMEDVLKSDKSCKFYTGVSIAVLLWLLNFLKDKAVNMTYWNGSETNEKETGETTKPGPRRSLSLKEELIITLLRLRRGFDTKSLGNMFGISESSVSRIFNTWVSLMSHDLSFLIRWPSKDQVLRSLPKCFKYFKKTRCIIDCTEFFIQRPSLPSSQRITYSLYKHHNTFKSLLGITPTGTFSFVSDLFSGSISDKQIVEDSGFLNKVEFGDDIMADRGFLIRGDLALKGATLNIPPFSMGKQLSANATTKTRRIARARIHVERAIGRLKNFCILQGVIPLRTKPIFNEVVKVCAMLCNLDNKLVK